MTDHEDRTPRQVPPGGTDTPASAAPRQPSMLPAIAAVILLTFALLAPILPVPFFTIDDSDCIRRGEELVQAMSQGRWFHAFTPRSHADARYYPGFALYVVARLALLGKNAVLWHVWQMCLYAAVGCVMVLAARRITRSAWPGVAAHVLLLATGTPEYESNWFCFLYTSIIETWLLLLWCAGAACAMAGIAGRRAAAGWMGAAGMFVAAAWALISKENAFIVTGMFFAPLAGAAWMWPERLGLGAHRLPFRLAFTALPVCAAAWCGVLYAVLPHGEEYGGTGSLAFAPRGMLRAVWGHFGFMVSSSFVLIPAALCILAARLAALRGRMQPRDAWQMLIVWAALCQVGSFAIWPSVTQRLTHPAYAAMLLFACCELAIAARALPAGASRLWGAWPAWFRVAAPVSLLAAVFGRLVLPAGMHMPVTGTIVAAWALAAVAALYAAVRRDAAVPQWAAAAATALAAYGVVVIALLAAVNLSCHQAEYRIREGVRNRVVRHVEQMAARNSRVAWIIPGEHTIFAYSANLYGRVFGGRPDLEQGPAAGIASKGPLRKGDLIVCYGPAYREKPAGTGQLSRSSVEEGAWFLFPRRLADIHRAMLHAVTMPFTRPDVRLEWRSTTVPVYRVESETWTFDAAYLDRHR